MMERVTLQVDQSIPSEYKDASNPLTLHLKDGRTLYERVDVPHGDWDDLLSLEELLGKYRENALRVQSGEDCERTIELMLSLETLSSVDELAALYARPALVGVA